MLLLLLTLTSGKFQLLPNKVVLQEEMRRRVAVLKGSLHAAEL
jgi:hypothetical protein